MCTRRNQAHLTIALLCCFNVAFSEIEVNTTKGLLRGRVSISRSGRPYNSFTGVPFAKPPVGHLRFAAPEPVDPWDGTLDAGRNSRIRCVQKDDDDSQEDCLYLNVYTPDMSGRLPVMFWIHGGAFSTGDGRVWYGPEYFMDENVVIVSANSRLGVLGYLSAEDDAIPGNYGAKDQVAALRWVRDNVGRFGGDAGRVTIFGGSSGGVGVGFHVLSPASKGLFHKAVMQSGTPMCRWSTSPPGVARERANAVGRIAGCAANASSGDTLKCLRALPARFFSDVHERLREWRTYPNILFAPVAERCDTGKEAFLCRHHLYEFKQESFVPAIIGLNSAEGAMVTSDLYDDTSLRYPEFRTDFNRLISIITSYQHYASDVDEIGARVLREYYPSGKIDDDSHFQTVQMITDGRYLHGILDMAFKLSSPVYFYLYDYQNEFSFNSQFGNLTKNLGVTHGDELVSLFKMDIINPNGLRSTDTKVSKRMVKIWSKFASSETPTIDGKEDGPDWPAFNLQDQKILHIHSDNSSVVRNPYEKKYAFWNELPILSNLFKEIFEKKFSSEQHVKNEL